MSQNGKATISSNDLLNVLKAIVAVDPAVISGSGIHIAHRCHYCRGLTKWSTDELKFNVAKHRKNCPWLAAKNYLADHA